LHDLINTCFISICFDGFNFVKSSSLNKFEKLNFFGFSVSEDNLVFAQNNIWHPDHWNGMENKLRSSTKNDNPSNSLSKMTN